MAELELALSQANALPLADTAAGNGWSIAAATISKAGRNVTLTVSGITGPATSVTLVSWYAMRAVYEKVGDVNLSFETRSGRGVFVTNTGLGVNSGAAVTDDTLSVSWVSAT